jgi:hypothetical protein
MPSGKKILALLALCGLALCELAWSQTGLTTIQDTLFTADGTRFTGTLTIQWNTFDTNNLGTIVQQSKSVPVVNGNLLVQLAPNATATPPANIYTVSYQSGGNQRFTEQWSIPVSTTPLTVRSVRASSLSTTSAPIGNTTTGPIAESDVAGLLSDLAVRPTKGAAFGANGVAIVDNNGVLETAVGQVGDCVLVDGTTGPCGAPTFADAETPGGSADGVNTTFTLSNTPTGASLQLFRNGIYQTLGFDYNLTASTITFVAGGIPQPGDTLISSYRVDPAAAGVVAAPAVRTTAAAQVLCSAPGITTGLGLWTTLGSCDVPASQLRSGDRIEVRFTFQHIGHSTGFDIEFDWGSTVALTRHGGVQDAALVGQVDAAIATNGALLTEQSWGTVLQFLPAVLAAAPQTGVNVSLKASVGSSTADSVQLVNFTVLRYPAN